MSLLALFCSGQKIRGHTGAYIELHLMTNLNVKSIMVALVFMAASDMPCLSPSGDRGYHSTRHGHYFAMERRATFGRLTRGTVYTKPQ